MSFCNKPSAFSIQHSAHFLLSPHPEELKIKVQNNEKPVLIIQSGFWGSSSRVYPDLNLNESSCKSVGLFLSPPLKKGDEGGFYNYNLFHISSMTASRFFNISLSENLITVIPATVK